MAATVGAGDPVAKKTVVVVGQTPPPMGGQAVMLQLLLDGCYESVTLVHARMEFSQSLANAGRFQIRKVAELARVVRKILALRKRARSRILYYPPSGSGRLPLWRDFVILGISRPFFDVVIFHFHASGLSATYNTLTVLERWLIKRTMFHPDIAITIAPSAPREGAFLKASVEKIVPNGIPLPSPSPPSRRDPTDAIELLFMGLICEGKGIHRLMLMAAELVRHDVDFRLTVAGQFETEDLKAATLRSVWEQDLTARINFPGVLRGEAKEHAFATAHVFVFPTQFHSETFPVVLLEAMAYALPVVTSDWRAIPDMVVDEVTGFLIADADPARTADAVRVLYLDEQLRRDMGANGQARFALDYSLEAHYRAMNDVFTEAASLSKGIE